MKLRTWTTVLCLLLLSAAALAEGEGKPRPDFDMAGGMERLMEASTPGEQHAYLGRYFAGDWETTSRVWMGGPDSEPSISHGSAHSEWILEGRYLRMDYHGSMMDQPMEGMAIIGFDKIRKHYAMFWIDSMSTSMTMATGSFDPSGMRLVLYGSMDEPMTGEIGKNVKYVFRVIDEDQHIFEIHDLVLGDENAKVVEITYKRKV